MPSPFPGMDPYLEHETIWHGFHERFIPALAEAISPQVRPAYFVEIDDHVYVHELPDKGPHLLGRGDVFLRKTETESRAGQAGGTITAPARVRFPAVDLERLSFLEIRAREDWRVITVLEVLSPTNKRAGPDREQFLAKRAQLLQSAVHYLEIDLLRGGPRLPFKRLPDCDYYALVSRVEERPEAGLWPIRLRQRLPVIPIPLEAPHPDAKLDLQAVLDRVYDAAGYDLILYQRQPKPRLSPKDAAWARKLLARSS
jgi:hypothetical protein